MNDLLSFTRRTASLAHNFYSSFSRSEFIHLSMLDPCKLIPSIRSISHIPKFYILSPHSPPAWASLPVSLAPNVWASLPSCVSRATCASYSSPWSLSVSSPPVVVPSLIRALSPAAPAHHVTIAHGTLSLHAPPPVPIVVPGDEAQHFDLAFQHFLI